ncbi:Transcriptional regulator, GntR family [Micrococcus lylae]|uniref:Transcriptional regulator, GntR family n=1 Tax=Micrococcus lylae TaxID=1273 RepID=A0A1R4IPW9_9MICC|nr:MULTISPECIES: GntR family transcriptional regulator [Micrococcus]MCT2008320.1 GntR family transcriptional regulator [Micrococcus lylae]MCT2072045.1 GntR family transcriptional regulator [Micrococcus lylae]OFR88891.1 GntR family transcriptional regulator [Micrococcus sp. HMSC067E09]PNL17207.1 GntR family transcriptional regulator [Micrococcus sp. FDAARGOS_333]WIK82009.1 GntR family transcriptional regulator [Micrococcus lylae]
MSKSEEAYARLTQKIETGELPPGAVLTEAALMDAAGTGRTPLREAVQRLVRDHWLSAGGGRGLQVPAISVDDQLERLEVRRSLEVLAVDLACIRAGEEQLADVEAHVHHLRAVSDLPAYVAAVGRSHELLRTIANNRYLSDSLVPLQGLSRRFWLATTKGLSGEVERGRAFYVPALEAVTRRDPVGARAGVLALHDFLARSALDYAARRAAHGRTEPPSPWTEGR